MKSRMPFWKIEKWFHEIFLKKLWDHTVWKNKKFSLTEKIFREINSCVNSLVKLLLSRNFTVWKLPKFTLSAFWQKFRESNNFTKEVTKELISRNIFWWERFCLCTLWSTVCKFKNFTDTKILREINLCNFKVAKNGYFDLFRPLISLIFVIGQFFKCWNCLKIKTQRF